jgi:glycosyltransferase involved in cell wall biosynthesis
MQKDDRTSRPFIVGGHLTVPAWRFIRELGRLRALTVISEAVAPPDCQLSNVDILSEREAIERFERRFQYDTPAAAIWFGPVWNFRAAQFWLRKRLAFPFIPFFVGILDQASPPTEPRILYTLLKHRIVEGCFASIEPAVLQNNDSVCTARVLISPDPAAVAVWIDSRRASRQKSLLWVDTSATRQSPAMRSLIDSAPALVKAGWELNVWCNTTDLSVQHANIIRLPKTTGPSSIPLFAFFFTSNFYDALHRWITGTRPAAIIQTTCGYLLSADICAVHFCNPAWIEIAKKLGHLDFKDHLRLLMHRIGSVFERWQFSSKSLKLLLPVSYGIGDAVRDHYRTKSRQIVLPNDYDDTVFNPQTISLHRNTIRKALGIKPDEIIFGFTSYGHYRRKGFWLIIDALKVLAEKEVTNIRLMVIGGADSAIAQLKRTLDQHFSAWSKFILFVGQQKQVERYLAAADAFLFPSYFEAASRAEVEAAAMGLPLFLTPHCGTEKFPREQIRGAWLEYDGFDIAKKMLAFANGEIPMRPISVGGALTPAEYADQLNSIYDELREQTKVDLEGQSRVKPEV